MAQSASTTRYLAFVPETTSIATSSADRMMVVPRSGCTNTSTSGMAPTATVRITSPSPMSRRTFESIAASIMIRVIRAKYDGLSWKPPSWNDRWAPFTDVPSGVRTSSSRNTVPT